MNRVALLSLTLLACASYPALAQPIESEPLPAPYTMQGETDPMALGGAPQPVTGPEAPINRGEAAPATPPPGADSITTYESTPITTGETPPPSNEAYPPGIQQNPGNTQAASPYPAPSADQYPNNAVSGVPPEDTSKFENRIFCTLKVSFGSIGTGVDTQTGEKVKSYLDSNLDKLSYQRLNWGREGEFSYCLTIKQHKDQASIYKDLKKIVPNRKTEDKPVTISGKGFEPTGNKRRDINN